MTPDADRPVRAQVDQVVGAGAMKVREERYDKEFGHVVLLDPEGNEFWWPDLRGQARLRRATRPSFFSWLPRLRRLVSSSQPSGNDRRRTRCQAEPTCRTSGRVL